MMIEVGGASEPVKPKSRFGGGAARIAAALLVAAAVSGCREEDRAMSFQPGVYGGVEDEVLSDETRGALRSRVDEQGSL